MISVVKTAEQFNQIPTIRLPVLEYLKSPCQTPRLIFIRHGESLSNQEKIIDGRTLNTDLTPLGIVQAQKRAQEIRELKIHFHRAFSSPMKRAYHTAEIILNELNQKSDLLKLDDRLYEKWYGRYEGAKEHEYAELRNREATVIPTLASFEEKFAYKAHPEVESMQDIYERVTPFIKEVCAMQPPQGILVAAHNGVMKSLFMADAARRGYDVEYRSFILTNCALLVVEVKHDQVLVLATEGLKFR